MKIISFLKTWTLPVAMLAGVIGYLAFAHIPLLSPLKPFTLASVAILQPLLIFAMLFITFCKVDPHELKPRTWHLWLLLIQTGGFCLPALLLHFFPNMPGQVVVEGAMICLICPTATAAAVITGKLGGNASSLTTYTIFINLLTALIIPLTVPLIHPHPEQSFLSSFLLIIGKVFPLLFGPFLAALAIRSWFPRLHAAITSCKDLAFYLWAVALAIAIAVTAKSIAHSTVDYRYQLGISAASLLCCAFQFWLGKRIGHRYGDSITAGQALGQKNTVLAIWMGYTFFTPVTSVAGGFYSVWHNVYNSYQLYRKSHD
ncbi:MAG: transporter [Paraprevotella sp.]|nr:transporter [Paraprevotella sp.]MBP3472367.1 transporter [Paraprevotella sp.]